MASRFLAATASAVVPVVVVAVVVGSCSSPDTLHPLADGGTTNAATTSASSTTGTTSSSTHATSSSTGAGGMVGTSSTGGTTSNGGATSTGGTAGAGGGDMDGGTDAIDCSHETGANCGGGGTCPPCVDGQHCNVASDCQSLRCVGGTCVAATCSDNLKDGMETDIDCGGPSCTACDTGRKCGSGPNAATNCLSHVCTSGTCQAATCNDGVANGNETDIDCGGGMCPPCHPGQKCNGAGDCSGMVCETTCQCPSGMVVAPIQGGGIYCIDATEVSYGQYQLFYDANPPPATQSSVCSWNLGWTPAGNWPALPIDVNNPVRNVNWCQAAAYCSYAARRLCGKIGGGPIAQASYADFSQDQWYNACTAQGTNPYPYGSAYGPTACNGADDGSPTAPSSWQSLMSCIGGETGLLEMSGNVAEWEDSCSGTAGATDTCLVRGGSYKSGQAALRCDSGGTATPQPRNTQADDVGFRCCL